MLMRHGSFLLLGLSVFVLSVADQTPAKVEWTTDLAKMKVPDALVAGRIVGQKIKAEKVEYRSFVSTLTVSQGQDILPDEARIIFLKEGESPEGRTFPFSPKGKGLGPHIHAQQRKPNEELPTTAIVTSGYALKLEFGKTKDGPPPGKIYICLPGQTKRVAAGTLEAVMK